MPISKDTARAFAPALVTSREPKERAAPGEPGSLGQVTLSDALIIVGVAWVLIFLLALSLRSHNI